MSLKPPLTCNHIPAQPGWLAVFAVELDGGVIADLHTEPVLAWRITTHEIKGPRGGLSDTFDSVTPVLASGSIAEETTYALQFGDGAYFTGDERIESKEKLIEWFEQSTRPPTGCYPSLAKKG